MLQTHFRGEFLTGIGFGLLIVGSVISLLGAGARAIYVVNSLKPDSRPLWFRAEGLLLLGGSISIIGVIVGFRLPWPFLIAAAIFGAAAVIFLRTRVNWW